MFSRRIKVSTTEGSCTVVMPASPFVRNSSHHEPEAIPALLLNQQPRYSSRASEIASALAPNIDLINKESEAA